ncbi:MAG: hypothetical protein ABFD10_14860 [Prolixibacteraceae bacterium]
MDNLLAYLQSLMPLSHESMGALLPAPGVTGWAFMPKPDSSDESGASLFNYYRLPTGLYILCQA